MEKILQQALKSAISELYQAVPEEIKLEKTNPDYPGDFTFVVFPMLRVSKKSPEVTAGEIGNYLKTHYAEIKDYNVIKGFLNIELNQAVYADILVNHWNNASFGVFTNAQPRKIMVEYSSPNTNKPLHLGHVRNNLLGYSIASILQACGNTVIKANLINDRGIHICKSMLAWKLFGNGETPQSSGMKGDHLAGKYYVEFDRHYKEEIKSLVASGLSEEEAEKKAPLILQAQEMLRQWEAGDPATIELWKTMNGWVYEGFNTTYTRLGVDFDKFYYESDTYKLGKENVIEGLEKNVFYRKDDHSIWIDLTADGLDQKLVQRSDGTSVYITQDIGTADEKYREFKLDESIYVVGNEQEYHFKVLFLILAKLGKSYAPGLHHLSYGMVDLPSGKMKSREGTVVDADNLMDEMLEAAEEKTRALGKTQGWPEEELQQLYYRLGMAALKFFILKVDPKKRMLFNPAESIDLQGDTGPFILYTYSRIQSMLRNAGEDWQNTAITLKDINKFEQEVLSHLNDYPTKVMQAGKEKDPSIICHYVLELAKLYNRFYNECAVLKEENEALRHNRLKLSHFVATTLKKGLNLLGIATVDRM